MKSARLLVVALLLHVAACVVSAQAPARVRAASPPIDSVAVTFSRPEKTFRVVGYVLDKDSRQPVSNVSVCWEGYPVRKARTDARGHFALYLPVARQKYYENGLITVQALCYESSAVIPADTATPVTLLLTRNAYQPKPYGCLQPADTAQISPYATRQLTGHPGTQCAFLIRDTTSRQPHKLRAVTIRVGRDGFTREPMRLRIYQYNERMNMPPGDDLLRENIVMCPPKEGVFTYDVGSYNIVVSGTGFFMGIEYTVGSDKFYCNDPIAAYRAKGSVLRPPCTRADTRTWEYMGGSAWHRATAAENCWPLYESALSVEVEPTPTPPKRR